mgnify:CR=1 FL=1
METSRPLQILRDVAAQDFDLVVIGGGPGGYGAALYATSAGLNVAVVEKDTTAPAPPVITVRLVLQAMTGAVMAAASGASG